VRPLSRNPNFSLQNVVHHRCLAPHIFPFYLKICVFRLISAFSAVVHGLQEDCNAGQIPGIESYIKNVPGERDTNKSKNTQPEVKYDDSSSDSRCRRTGCKFHRPIRHEANRRRLLQRIKGFAGQFHAAIAGNNGIGANFMAQSAALGALLEKFHQSSRLRRSQELRRM